MSVQVEPYQLRFLASRMSAGAHEIRMRANRLESIMNELVQGSWKGEGSHAFAVKCEVMKGELQKASDVLDSAVLTLNRFANQMERVNQLRQQANMLEQQSWQYSGDSIDDLHHRQNLARQAAQIRQEAEWEANSADAQAANEFNMIMAMIPKIMEQVGQYMGSNGNTDTLDDLPEPLRSYYLRHKDLLHDDGGETAATVTMGSYKQADYDGVTQYEQEYESENETWYEKTWDWIKAEGREFVVDYKQHWTTGNIWYDEANYWLLGIPDKVKRVFHTKPFSLENWEANLDLFISVVPAAKVESVALDGAMDASMAVNGEMRTEIQEVSSETTVTGLDITKISPLVKTEPDTAFFWSGKTNGVGGAEKAMEIANSKGGTTLENMIETKGIKMPEWDINDPASIKAWQDISDAYAKQVSGEVRAVVGSNLRKGNIWKNVELPRLMENPNVTKITTIDPDTLVEKVIFERGK